MVNRSCNSVSLELGVVFPQKVFYEAKSWDSGLKDKYWSLVKKSVVLKEKGTQWEGMEPEHSSTSLCGLGRGGKASGRLWSR